MPSNLTVIILTKNEEKHIRRCINSFSKTPTRIVIVDSFSTDKTIEIAKELGADIYQRNFYNHSDQFQWAIENTNIQTEWVMRMDADEIWEESLAAEIEKTLKNETSVNGIIVNRKYIFMDKWLKYGGIYPLSLLRIWRRGAAKIEQRFMDEHMVLQSGSCITLNNHIVDHNLNGITLWTNKHNHYASREMIDYLNIDLNFYNEDKSLELSGLSQATIKRFFKKKIYNQLPLFIRAIGFFVYRYIIKLAFLDGKQGFIYAILQAFWYRFLVDVKVLEFKKALKKGRSAKEILKTDHNIEI